MISNLEKPLVNPQEQTERLDLEDSYPEYSVEELEGMDDAAGHAADMVEAAVKNGGVHHEVTHTSRGLRGRVADGGVEALFDGNTLEQVNITIGSGDSQHVVTIDQVEADPVILLDGKPIDPSDIPSAQAVVAAMHEMRTAVEQEKNATTAPEIPEVGADTPAETQGDAAETEKAPESKDQPNGEFDVNFEEQATQAHYQEMVTRNPQSGKAIEHQKKLTDK